MTVENKRKRLQFRSWHRGTREMDLLLGSFADLCLGDFTPEQLCRYEELLQISDPDLYNWITGKEPVPLEHEGDVMRMLCVHRFTS